MQTCLACCRVRGTPERTRIGVCRAARSVLRPLEPKTDGGKGNFLAMRPQVPVTLASQICVAGTDARRG